VPLHTDEAFVLDAAPHRERDKIVTFYTETEGKLRGVAHGAARSVRRFGGRLERLSRVRVTWFEKEGADLARIDDVELIEESFRLQEDLRVSAAVSYVCEIAVELAREREADRRFFRLLGAVLAGFRAGVPVDLLARYFEFWTGRLHGVLPGFETCDACSGPFGAAGARVAAADGSALCSRCARGAAGRLLVVSRAALSVMEAFRIKAPRDLGNVAFPAAALREIESAAGAALAAFAGREFRARAFLDQVTSGEAR
jgi:DNA repair protein RecO (recombination protein O)